MDGPRFDDLTRRMATGTSRRQALRLAGGGLVGALLTAVGIGRQAAAREQDIRPCDEVLAQCVAQVAGGCDHLPLGGLPYYSCLAEHGGVCSAYFEACATNCGAAGEPGDNPFDFDRRACAGGCPGHGICTATVSPTGKLLCRCLNVD